MQVKTNNPVIVNNKKISTEDMYIPAEGNTEESNIDVGGVKVSTIYPVIVNGVDKSPREYYSAVDDIPYLQPKPVVSPTQTIPTSSSTSSSSTMTKSERRKKQRENFKQKAGQAWDKVKNSPLAQYAAQSALAYIANGSNPYQNKDMGNQGVYENQLDPSKTEEDTKMKTGTKIALGVAGIVVLGLIIYAATSKKK